MNSTLLELFERKQILDNSMTKLSDELDELHENIEEILNTELKKYLKEIHINTKKYDFVASCDKGIVVTCKECLFKIYDQKRNCIDHVKYICDDKPEEKAYNEKLENSIYAFMCNKFNVINNYNCFSKPEEK